MAKEYKVGEKYYLPVTVERIVEGEFGVTLSYTDGDEGDTALIWNAPDLLLTAEEIYASRKMADEIDHIEDMLDYGRKKYDEIEELKARNSELEALLKEVTATRDEAIRQNDELIADRNNWKEAAQKYRDNAKVADAAADELRAENKKLMAAADKLKDTLVDRTKDVQHLTEENAKLQNKVSEFQNRVGEQLAQIQDLNAEVHFLKAPKEAKKPVHVFTNDGTEVEFRRYTDVTYRTDYNILVIKDGEEIVAGFIRGDRPGNLAYWWTE